MFNNLIGKNKELGRFLFCERYTLPPVKNAIYIAEGQELKRGAVVDVNGVLVGTNSLMPYAVLEFDCDTRDGGKEASVFIKGEFNFDKLYFASGLSKSDMDNIVYNGSGLGIVIKPYNYEKIFRPQEKIDDVTLLISDYCKGDGVTDVSDALQNALNDAEGKTLILKEGVYIFSKTLVVPSNTKVIGNGSKSVLKITSDRTLSDVPWRTSNASTKKPYIMTESTSENVLLSNFVLSGEGTDYIDQNEDGIMIQGKGHRLELVEVHHINYDYASFLTRSCLCPAWGIDFFNAEGCVAEQCHAYNCGYESIGCEKSTDITINKGRFAFSCQTRVQVHKECKNIYITNNLVYTGDNNGHVAPFITLDANKDVPSANIYIIGNTTEGSCTHIAGGENFVFWIGNRIGGDIAHQNSASSPANNWVFAGNRIRQAIGIGVNNATFTGNIIENATHNEYAINLYGSGESHAGNLILYGSEIQVVS